MEKLTKTASRLDKFLRVISIFADIAVVCMIVGLSLIAAYFLLDLGSEMIGSGFATADLGFLTVTVAETYTPDIDIVFGEAALEMFLSLLCLIVGKGILKCIRNILKPMTLGEPFHAAISTNLIQLAKYTCSFGIAVNLMEIISNILLVKAYDLPNLILGEKITYVSFENVFDLSFLLAAAVFLLLSYVFRYGEQLQQLSDETL